MKKLYTASSAAFCIYENKILLMLRDDIPHIHCPNTWGLPGGFIEPNETDNEACRRELLEEISVTPSQIEKLFTINKNIKPNRIHTFSLYRSFFTQSEASKIKLGDEGQKLEFFEWDEIAALKLESELDFFMRAIGVELKSLVYTEKIENFNASLALLGKDYFKV